MVFQTLYYLVDLFFVGQLGDAAVAGLTSAGNVGFLIMAVTQILGGRDHGSHCASERA